VPVLDLAVSIGGPLKASGQTLIGRCVLPDHEDRTPSFTLYRETESWWCFGCSRGGDVVDLASLAWGFDNLGEAAGYLLLEFGHQLPGRPAGWYRRQDRQKAVRERLEAQRVRHVRLLVFRLVCLPWLKRLPASVREEASFAAWNDCLPLARMLYGQRRGAV
jgi:hypothetical protein